MEEKINVILDEAYELYMPQIRSEIYALTNFVLENTNLKNNFPINVLEIGTKYGGTFWIWNRIVEEFGCRDSCHWTHWNIDIPKIISIDMSDGGLHGGISEDDMNSRDLTFYQWFKYVHFIRGDSHSSPTLTRLLQKLYPKYRINKPFVELYDPVIDFLFIDGDHSYEGVKQDFEMYSPLVKKGGIIAFHDTNDSQRHRDRGVMVSQFWNELRDLDRYDTVEFNAGQDWAGIGIIIKS